MPQYGRIQYKDTSSLWVYEQLYIFQDREAYVFSQQSRRNKITQNVMEVSENFRVDIDFKTILNIYKGVFFPKVQPQNIWSGEIWSSFQWWKDDLQIIVSWFWRGKNTQLFNKPPQN